MTNQRSTTAHLSRSAPIGWPVAFAAATVLGTLATACMMPFVGLAVVAAATLPLRRAVATVAVMWAVSQGLGFALLGYPATGYAIAWGVALGCASLAAMLVSRRLLGRAPLTTLRLVGVFLAAFALDEALLFGFAGIVGGTETFTPRIIAQLLANDGAWFAGLVALYFALTNVAPRVFGRSPALRLA